MVKFFRDVTNLHFWYAALPANIVHCVILKAGVEVGDEAKNEEFLLVEFSRQGQKFFQVAHFV